MAATAPQSHDRSTTQKYLDIHDITNDLVILRDGSVSLVMQVNAINFGLLSEPEQDAIIYAYAALINSLSFPIEIVIQSHPKDVSRYLEYIENQLNSTTSDLRRRQIAQYKQFVTNLITDQNVLDKSFYVVLPLSALEVGVTGSLNPLGTVTDQNKDITFDKYYVLEKAKNILIPRKDHMISQFGRLGLVARQLGTKELIHLFYVAYNAESAEGARIVDTRDYTTALIQTNGANTTMPNSMPSNPQPVGNFAGPAEQAASNPALQQANAFQPAVGQAAPNPAAPTAMNTNLPLQPEAVETASLNTQAVNEGNDMNLGNVGAIPQESFAPSPVAGGPR